MVSISLPWRRTVRPKAVPVPRYLRGYEEVLVVHSKWSPGYKKLLVPKTELVDADVRGRYIKRKSRWRWLFPPLGAFFGLGLAFIPMAILRTLAVVDSFKNPIIAGSIVGIIAGILAMRLVRGKALWAMRLKDDDSLTPVYPRPLLLDYMEEDEEKPMVIRGSYMAQIERQPHIRRLYAAERRRFEKLQIGMLILFALAMIVLLFFFKVMTGEGG